MKLYSFLQKCKLCQNPQTSQFYCEFNSKTCINFQDQKGPSIFCMLLNKWQILEKLRIKKVEQEISATITATVLSCNQNTRPEEFKTATSLSATFWALKP